MNHVQQQNNEVETMNKTKTRRVRSLAAPACALILALLAAAPAARADSTPPDRMTFQGYLTDATGAALGTSAPKNYDIVFRIYDALSGGNRVWSEQQTVTVDKGYYSVLLGEGTAVSGEVHPALSALFVGASASDRYVEITVKGASSSSDSTIAPRLRLLTSPYAYLASQATAASSLGSATNVYLTVTNNQVVFSTTNTMVIGSSKVGIGTTSPRRPLDVIANGSNSWIAACFGNSSYPNGASVVIGDTFGYALIGAYSAALDSWQDLYIGTTLGSDGSVGCPSTLSLPYVHIGSRAAGVGAGAEQGGHLLKLSGGAYCDGNGAWVSGSDRAYKKDVKDMTQYGLAQVLALRPVTYVHKQDKDGKTQLGFIAQEVKPIVPEVVDGPDGSMGLAYDRLVPVLVNAIKEQQAQITQLNGTVAELKAALQAKAAK